MSLIFVSSDQKVFRFLPYAFYLGVASVYLLYHKGLINGVFLSISVSFQQVLFWELCWESLRVWLLYYNSPSSLVMECGWTGSCGVLVVQYIFHLQTINEKSNIRKRGDNISRSIAIFGKSAAITITNKSVFHEYPSEILGAKKNKQ